MSHAKALLATFLSVFFHVASHRVLHTSEYAGNCNDCSPPCKVRLFTVVQPIRTFRVFNLQTCYFDKLFVVLWPPHSTQQWSVQQRKEHRQGNNNEIMYFTTNNNSNHEVRVTMTYL